MRWLLPWLSLVVLACGGAPTAKVVDGSADGSTAPKVPADPLPTTVAIELAKVMPAGLDGYAAAPGTRELGDAFSQVVDGVDFLDGFGRGVAAELGASPRAVTQVLRNVDGIAVGLRLDGTLLAVLRTTDERGIDTLLEHPALEEGARGRYDVAGADGVELAWHPERGLLYLGVGGVLDEVDEVLAGRAPALATVPAFAEEARRFEPDPAVNVWGDLPRLLAFRGVEGVARSPLHAAVTLDEQVSLRVEAALAAPALEPDLFAPPVPLTLAAELPRGTVGFLSFSLATGGAEADRGRLLYAGLEAIDDELAHEVASAVATLGKVAARAPSLGRRFGLEDLLRSLGDEGTVGVVVGPGDEVTIVARQRLRDAEVVASAVAALRMAMEAKGQSTRDVPNGFAWTPEKREIAVSLDGDQLVVAVGPDAATRVAPGGPVLGDDGAYRRTRAQLSDSHLAMWIDAARVMDALGDRDDEVARLIRTAGRDRAIGVFTLQVEPETDAFRLRAKLHDAGSLGMASAVVIYSVRRYLASSKATEAKNVTAAIARAAIAAREGSGQSQWCKSAVAVPAEVPHGMKYQPSERAGEDFGSGDATGGWQCLGFSLREAHYYQYRYRRGSGYLGPARGGPDPGPHGFEASAVGDLDGDGVTSLFTVVGRVDPKTGAVEIERFVADELE